MVYERLLVLDGLNVLQGRSEQYALFTQAWKENDGEFLSLGYMHRVNIYALCSKAKRTVTLSIKDRYVMAFQLAQHPLAFMIGPKEDSHVSADHVVFFDKHVDSAGKMGRRWT